MPNLKKENRRKPIEKFFCVICGEPISADRMIRKAVTCSEQHAKVLKLERRRLRDMVRCRFCNRPATPAERAEFIAWRRSRGIKPGRKPKPKEEHEQTPLEQELGTIQVN
jgi:predicted nucleic acid-binding Zn ribbon protein